MKHFMKGALVGLGVGLLVAPVTGKEMRRILAERFTELRNSLPADSPINQYLDQASGQVMYTKDHWRDYAQQAVSKAKDTGTTLGTQAMSASQDMAGNLADKAKKTSQDLADKAKQKSQDLTNKVKSS